MRNERRIATHTHRQTSIAGTMLLLLAMVLGIACNRIIDAVRPFSHTTVRYSGSIVDTLTNEPLGSASVTISGVGRTVLTDANGQFYFDDVPTGMNVLTVTRSGFKAYTLTVDVTLQQPSATFPISHEEAPPAIDTAIVTMESMRFFNDSITVSFQANDSSGGIIGAALITCDTDSNCFLEHKYDSSVFEVQDTFTFHTATAGSSSVLLQIIGSRFDTAARTLTIANPKVRRPSFSLVRFSDEPFRSGEWGYVELSIEDPDSIMDHLVIDWADGSAPISSPEHYYQYWHNYSVTALTTFKIGVSLFDSDSLLRDTVLELRVDVVSPPLLDDKIFYEPEYCTIHDKEILIGVRVLQIENDWVRQIDWFINKDDPLALRHESKTYTNQTGLIDKTSGNNVFVCPFQSDTLRRINDVEIIVTDESGYTNNVTGSFTIAGKPE